MLKHYEKVFYGIIILLLLINLGINLFYKKEKKEDYRIQSLGENCDTINIFNMCGWNATCNGGECICKDGYGQCGDFISDPPGSQNYVSFNPKPNDNNQTYRDCNCSRICVNKKGGGVICNDYIPHK